jgi:DoxX-like family
MNIALWIAAIVVALINLAAGAVKLVKSRESLLDSMPWASGISDNAMRGIGVIELLGAIGLILPAVTGIATILVPIAAVGLGITQIVALLVNLKFDAKRIPVNVVLIALSAFIAWGRFGPHAF